MRATRLAPARAIVAPALSRDFATGVVRDAASLFDVAADIDVAAGTVVAAVAGGASTGGAAREGAVSSALA